MELLNLKVAQDARCRRIMLALPDDLEPISVGSIRWQEADEETGCNWRWTGEVFGDVPSVTAQRLSIPGRARRLAAAVEPIVRRLQKRFRVAWEAEFWWLRSALPLFFVGP